ncbi:unnamed protein product [Microthlaspi erraticum]|uniref:Retrotransposon gag domain-containing protein n=1 Tax=Microthlaspi erraticum TaxID=1685480 RepID=A0A6D2HU02_9BRAS|nr:unnamed protein product [Microthlaspi erraticum]
MGDNGNPNMAAQLQQLQQQIEQMRKAQQDREPQPRPAIGDKDNPHTFYQNRSAIVPPNVQRQDFEIKPGMIALVKDHIFHGLPAEIPADHIQNFEEICSTTGSNGVPADFLKCKLFPFSLANKASRWLKSLPPGSLTSWDQVRAAFLDHFYTKASFQQYDGEAFCEAWERYKECRRECPHHGYSDEQILSIFYDGVNWDYRNALNAASNGDFMTKSKEGAFELIENLAASSSNKNAEYDRTVSTVSVKGSSADAKKIEELTAKVNLLMKAQQKSVHENDDAPISQEFGGEEDDDDQMEDQVYPPRSNQNQQSYQKSYPNSFQEKTFAPNQNRSQGGNQQKAQFSNQQQPSGSSNNSNDELKGMMQQMLMNQQKSTAETHLKIDTMYNDLNGKYEAVWTHVKKLDVQVAQTAEAVKRPHGTLPGKGEQTPGTRQARRKPTRTGRSEVDRAASSGVDRAGDDASKDLEDAKCKEMLKDLTVKLPLSDAVQMIPALKKYMKELISGKVAEDENVMLVSRSAALCCRTR